nr:hypothetical protein [Tanacetum cinerariifolium]
MPPPIDDQKNIRGGCFKKLCGFSSCLSVRLGEYLCEVQNLLLLDCGYVGSCLSGAIPSLLQGWLNHHIGLTLCDKDDQCMHLCFKK